MNLSKPIIALGAIASGWCFIANIKLASQPQAIKLEPVVHTQYDPASIGKNISFHESRVSRDPEGAIGWSMLAEAWLVRSRESDSDAAAWKAEDAARQSLKLRWRGNGRAFQALVASLLEQHRFQDARAELETVGNRTRVYADVLAEVGELDQASQVLAALNKPEDPSIMATAARISSERGEHQDAVALLQRARLAMEPNASVSDQTLAWFDTKIGSEYLKLGETTKAKESFTRALELYPRSYKATLGLANVAAKLGDWSNVEEYASRTLTIANSLDAVSLLGDARKSLGYTQEANSRYQQCLQMYQDECATFVTAKKGGPFMVRPIDRQFATFCVKHKMFLSEGLTAAKRDFKNRPDKTAKDNLTVLSMLVNENKTSL